MSADDFLNRITRAPVVSGVLIEQRGRYLVLQHRNPPDAYGLWGWPAGFVEQGDELEATAVREAKEETGLDVRLMRELGVFHTHATDVVKHLYSAEVVGGELRVDEAEIMDARWLSRDEVETLGVQGVLRAEWVVDGIELHEALGARPSPAP
jgi:ADP-ribose pyrophosphatase YjhB (NUDIX family)